MRTVAALGILGFTLADSAQVSPDTVVLPMYDKPLTIRTKVQPTYPPAAKHAHVEGTVLLHVLIGVDGHMQSVQPFFGPEMLRDAAVETVRQWVYEPYVKDGTAHPVSTDIAVDYAFTTVFPPGIKRISQSYVPASTAGAIAEDWHGLDYKATFAVTQEADAYRVLAQQNQASSFIELKGQADRNGHLSELQQTAGDPHLLETVNRIAAVTRVRLKVDQGQVVPYEVHLRYEFQRSDVL